jgi:hypothetical protein
MRGLPPALDENGLPLEPGHPDEYWVHGLLRSLADSPRARQARLERFARRLSQEVEVQRKWLPARPGLWGIGVLAAALLLMVLLGLHYKLAQAHTLGVLREAQGANAQLPDRCYYFQLQPEPGALNQRLLPIPLREARLWTRGDCFWFECIKPGLKLAYGRDRQGRLWIANSPWEGIRYEGEESELPPWMAITCEVGTMRIEKLLEKVLADFILYHEPPPPGSNAPHVIRAEPKPDRPHPLLGSALLEIDTQTKIVKRVVLRRLHQGRPLLTVTYTFLESRVLSDESYQLEGHLQPGARIESRTFQRAVQEDAVREDPAGEAHSSLAPMDDSALDRKTSPAPDDPSARFTEQQP